ncbi:hypothetical protein [Selenomonas ruminantium]|uniref:Uncharacterized protein n=1 Tax=Selenomonas ruminantium TaxID=971 RepID=A0A1I0VEM5_SELRU|nr:hypothetical protein [Selenomonas ruminantium]SFA74771.1 hypothetical protein SAMN05216587_101544 [Selenomonas ruminantium]
MILKSLFANPKEWENTGPHRQQWEERWYKTILSKIFLPDIRSWRIMAVILLLCTIASVRGLIPSILTVSILYSVYLVLVLGKYYRLQNTGLRYSQQRRNRWVEIILIPMVLTIIVIGDSEADYSSQWFVANLEWLGYYLLFTLLLTFIYKWRWEKSLLSVLGFFFVVGFLPGILFNFPLYIADVAAPPQYTKTFSSPVHKYYHITGRGASHHMEIDDPDAPGEQLDVHISRNEYEIMKQYQNCAVYGTYEKTYMGFHHIHIEKITPEPK